MDLEQKAFERLRLGEQMSKRYYKDKPQIICYSGGKDSDVGKVGEYNGRKRS